jgi:CubicO group peptidase (beta-lactamase class C family)
MADIRLKLNKLRREKELKRLSFVLIIIVAALTTFVIGYFNHISKNAKAVSHISVHSTSKANPPMKKMNSKWEEANNNPAIYDYLKSINFTGTALVVKDNKILLNKGFGDADLEKKIPNNPQTVHYIGSITKVFISTSIMQLQEKGKLNINDPLSKYIPDFPNGNQITLYHLLTYIRNSRAFRNGGENIP